MTFTTEQLKTLSQWEEHFKTAVRADWSRNPGHSALVAIHEIYVAATGAQVRFNDGCNTCILRLLKEVGTPYFADIKTDTKRVATSTAKAGKKSKVKMEGNK